MISSNSDLYWIILKQSRVKFKKIDSDEAYRLKKKKITNIHLKNHLFILNSLRIADAL